MTIRRRTRPSARQAARVAVVGFAALAAPTEAADVAAQTPPLRLLCEVAPDATQDVQPAARDRACGALARLLGVEAENDPKPDAGLVVVLHLTQADGRRLAGWIDWSDARPGAPMAHGTGRPAAAMLPDRAASDAFPEESLNRFLSLSLRDAAVPKT